MIYQFDLAGFQIGWAFQAIRSKSDIILAWINTIKLMAVDYPIPAVQRAGRITLQVDRRSRLIFEAGPKMYSLNFPFVVTPFDPSGAKSGYSVKTRSGIELTGQVASDIVALFTGTPSIQTCGPEDYVDHMLAYVGKSPEVIDAVRYMTEEEDGYLRCDHDPVNVNGHRHPLHHVDIFYTNSSSFKLGRRQPSTVASFMDMLDVSTDCHYVGPF